MPKRKGIGSHTAPNQGSTDSWITPKWIIDELGPFDLDPCRADPQPWACAVAGYTGNGLCKPWAGRVWLNPPYGKQTGTWLSKLATHRNGTALIFARTETEMFFSHVWKSATALLFIEKRLFFHYPDGTKAKSNSGGPSVLIAYDEFNALKLQESKIPGAFIRDWDHANRNGSGQ